MCCPLVNYTGSRSSSELRIITLSCSKRVKTLEWINDYQHRYAVHISLAKKWHFYACVSMSIMDNRCVPFCCVHCQKQNICHKLRFLCLILQKEIFYTIYRFSFSWVGSLFNNICTATPERRCNGRNVWHVLHIHTWQCFSSLLSPSSYTTGIPLTSSSPTCRNAINLKPSFKEKHIQAVFFNKISKEFWFLLIPDGRKQKVKNNKEDAMFLE